MCVAMPGKILEINDHKAKVSFNGMEMNLYYY